MIQHQMKRRGGCVGGTDRSVDLNVVGGGQGQLGGGCVRFCDDIIHQNVTQSGGVHRTCTAQNRDIAACQSGRNCRSGHVTTCCSNFEIRRVDQPDAMLAIDCECVDPGAIRHPYTRCRGLNEPAIATDRSRRIQSTADMDRAIFHVGQHLDLTTPCTLRADAAIHISALDGPQHHCATL